MESGVHGDGVRPHLGILGTGTGPEIQPQAVLGVDVDVVVRGGVGSGTLTGARIVGGGLHQTDPAGGPLIAGVAPGVAGGGGLGLGDGQGGVHGDGVRPHLGVLGAGAGPEVQTDAVLGVDVNGVAGPGRDGQQAGEQNQAQGQAQYPGEKGAALHRNPSSLFGLYLFL